MKVPEEKLEDVAKIVNSYHGVTHNYLRDFEYNMWFTVIAPSHEDLESTLEEIKERTNIDDLLNLPAVNFYKINVNFQLKEKSYDTI